MDSSFLVLSLASSRNTLWVRSHSVMSLLPALWWIWRHQCRWWTRKLVFQTCPALSYLSVYISYPWRRRWVFMLMFGLVRAGWLWPGRSCQGGLATPIGKAVLGQKMNKMAPRPSGNVRKNTSWPLYRVGDPHQYHSNSLCMFLQAGTNFEINPPTVTLTLVTVYQSTLSLVSHHLAPSWIYIYIYICINIYIYI